MYACVCIHIHKYEGNVEKLICLGHKLGENSLKCINVADIETCHQLLTMGSK